MERPARPRVNAVTGEAREGVDLVRQRLLDLVADPREKHLPEDEDRRRGRDEQEYEKRQQNAGPHPAKRAKAPVVHEIRFGRIGNRGGDMPLNLAADGGHGVNLAA